MKKVFKPMRVFVSMLVLSSSFCFTACSNDDENTPQLPDEVTTGTMFGNFSGIFNPYVPICFIEIVRN